MSQSVRVLTEQDKTEIYEYIRRFLSDELDVPLAEIGPGTRIIDDLKGDSMIYLELIDEFRKRFEVQVEISLIGRYLQTHPVYTVGETAQTVYDILERGDTLLVAPTEANESGSPADD